MNLRSLDPKSSALARLSYTLRYYFALPEDSTSVFPTGSRTQHPPHRTRCDHHTVQIFGGTIRTRTETLFQETRFEPVASANFAIVPNLLLVFSSFRHKVPSVLTLCGLHKLLPQPAVFWWSHLSTIPADFRIASAVTTP